MKLLWKNHWLNQHCHQHVFDTFVSITRNHIARSLKQAEVFRSSSWFDTQKFTQTTKDKKWRPNEK